MSENYVVKMCLLYGGQKTKYLHMEEVFKNMVKKEICKICNREFVSLTLSHIKTHGIDTRDAYNEYVIDTVTSEVKEEKVESIWDYVDVNSMQYKMRVVKLGKTIVMLRSSRNVTIENERKCPQCNDRIYEPHAFVHLRTRWERTARELQTPQDVMHKPCAIASGNMANTMAMVKTP